MTRLTRGDTHKELIFLIYLQHVLDFFVFLFLYSAFFSSEIGLDFHYFTILWYLKYGREQLFSLKMARIQFGETRLTRLTVGNERTNALVFDVVGTACSVRSHVCVASLAVSNGLVFIVFD